MHLPWHKPVMQQLTALRDSNQLASAIALTAVPGWGHEQLLADAALALLETDTNLPIEEFAHPDFRWLAPDGAVIKIDQVRKVVEFAVQTPQHAPRKVAAVLDAHLLNHNAANALLKTLEEPPPNTHILLATADWGKVIPTIRSRCQRLSVGVDTAVAEQWLQQQGVAVTPLDFMLAGRAPLTALASAQTSEDGEAAQSPADLSAWLIGLPQQKLAVAVEEALSGSVVDLLGRWYRRLLLSLYEAPLPGLTMQATHVHGFCDRLLAVRRQIETSNSANTRLLFESLIVEWCRMTRAEPHQ